MKILTIDFNCIFYSCIRLYEEKVAKEENASTIWNFLDDRYDMTRFVDYDSKLLLKLAQIISSNDSHTPGVKSRNSICVEQSNIVQWITEDVLKEENPPESISITNIDFFDDLNLVGQSKTNINRFDKYDYTNWLGYLYSKGYIQEVTWYKAANSDVVRYPDDIKYTIKSFRDLDELINGDFDYVIISTSPKYVPYKYRHLVDLLAMIGE